MTAQRAGYTSKFWNGEILNLMEEVAGLFWVADEMRADTEVSRAARVYSLSPEKKLQVYLV